jgi:hypothetical protein
VGKSLKGFSVLILTIIAEFAQTYLWIYGLGALDF